MTSIELVLYVTGTGHPAQQATAAARRLCAEQLGGQPTLTVVDTAAHPELAAADRVWVTPTLVRRRPAPERRVVGDLAETARVLAALGLSGAASTATGSA
jgi:circadian clock protein KaiB